MKEQSPLSTLSLAILGLVCRQPMSGYDLRKLFATTPLGHFSTSPGAIYPALRRLQREGLVKGTVERKQTLRPRQVFALTKRGAEALAQELRRPVTRDDVIWHLDKIMLRFAFGGYVVGREQTLVLLKQFIAQTEEYLAWLREQVKLIPDQRPSYGRMALGHGLEMYQANARWARDVIRQLEEESDAG
jgi:DNA-binding PadR family transcriptional regulator